jgi:hypothetical protein
MWVSSSKREHCEPSLPGIRAGLGKWPAGTSAAERKMRLFDDRLIELALNRVVIALSNDPHSDRR